MTVIWTQSPEELAQEKAQRRLDQLNGIPERDGPAAAEIGGGGRFGLRFARRSQDRALDRELEARKIDVLERQGDARLMNERSVAMTEALSGLRGGFGRPAVSSNLGGMSRITPQAPRASIAASIDEDLDEVDPMRPRAYKNGGVIGNVKKDDGSDKVPVVAREGEYYINPETVAHIGGGDYKQGLRSLNALVREATGKEPGSAPVGKFGLRGFAAGGYVDSPERLAWLKDIAVRGNRDPEAQAALRTFNEAQVGPAQPEPQTPVSLRRLPDEPRPAPQTFAQRLRGTLDARAAETMSKFQQGMAEERTNGGMRQRMQNQTNATSPEQLGQPSESTPMQATGKSLADLIPSKEAVKDYFVGLNERVTGVPRAVADGAQERTFNAPPTQNEQAAIPLTSSQPETADDFRTRNAAADVYRREWQRQSPGGLRNANSQALDTYNAEQQTRGTGIESAGRRYVDRGYGKRNDGTEKGSGYFGELKMKDGSGNIATEMSIGVNIDGKEVEIPMLVPTLSESEKDHLLSGKKPTDAIVDKAVAHAMKRMGEGKSPFANSGKLLESPKGAKGEMQALDTYNAEQQTRGTGISAQRQANGVMEFSGSGPAPKAQYLDAGGNPTNEWQDTSQYRDAVVRSLGSSDPAMQQRGLAQAMQLQQRNQRGVSTGNPEMDQLLGQMDPREAAAVYRALNGGQGADGKGPKATPYGEQQKRVIDALGEEGAAKAMQEIQQAQMQMARQLIQSGQATPEQAEVAVQNPQFITRLTNAYKLREFLAQNGQWGEAASGAGGWGTAAGLAAGGLTLGLTRNPSAAAKIGAAGAALGAGIGGAQGFTQGAQGFDAAMPLTGLMNITPLPDGDYQIGNAVIPKAMVQKNYQLFGLTAPPK